MNFDELPENIKSKIQLFGEHWLWIGAVRDETRENKQPVVRFAGKMRLAHRVVYHIATGFDLDSELQANHKVNICDMSLCINPEHVYEGTQLENIQDTINSGRIRYANKTHCNYGHDLSVSPTTGHRYCQTCKNKRRDEWRKNKI